MKAQTISKTFHYTNELRWKFSRLGTLVAENKPPLQVSSPPEFRGMEGNWTPEDLLVASVNACLMLTFLSIAEREHLAVTSYESAASGTVERVEDTFRFSTITMEPTVELEDSCNAGRVEEILRQAEKNCLIGNSVKAVLHVKPRVLAVAD